MAKRTIALLLGLAALLAGCSADWYTHDADREVYGIVAEKEADTLGRVRPFNVRPRPDPVKVLGETRDAGAPAADAAAPAPQDDAPAPPDDPAAPNEAAGAGEVAPSSVAAEAPAPPPQDLPQDPADADGPAGMPPAVPGPGVLPAAADGPGAEADRLLDQPPADLEDIIPEDLPPPVPEATPDAVHLTMADALRVAVAASRRYQAQKEDVYLSALALTFQRYLFRPHPTFTGTVDHMSDFQDGTGRVRSWDPGAEVGVSQQLADGAVVAGSLGVAALKYLNKELGDTVDAALDFSLAQPLWRGAGRQVVQENLLQAERNAVYAIRSFARFEKTFAVQVASEYLQTLQARDAVMNAWNNYESLRRGRQQSEWLAKAERLAEFEVDQARQSEFTAYNNWIVARENYINALDAFKLTLGIPVTTEIALVPDQLDRLRAAGLEHPEQPLPEATATALATRLDLANTEGALEDAGRKIMVAEDGLKGDVDLVASIGYAPRSDTVQSARIALARGDYSIGFDIDLPVDRLSERNALRETQLARQAARRTLEEARDNVVLDVRQAHRRLQQARESYDIQRRSVTLAQRRVESTRLLLQAGRVEQRDLLDAEAALLDARNALTRALVDHTIARLQFARDLGTLRVDEKGQIHGWVLTDNGP
ncbi:MAG: TolC family protein [Phycisphaerae bacterium]